MLNVNTPQKRLLGNQPVGSNYIVNSNQNKNTTINSQYKKPSGGNMSIQDITMCLENTDKHCKTVFLIIGISMAIFFIWLIILSWKGGKQGPPGIQGPRGDPGVQGPQGPPPGPTAILGNIQYITKNEDYTSSTTIKSQDGFIMGNGVKSSKQITLPHFSVIGNGAVLYIYNQSAIYSFKIKAAKIEGKDPAQMWFSPSPYKSGSMLKIPPNKSVTIVIMANVYTVFGPDDSKPTIHWVSSWDNCGGVSSDNIIYYEDAKGFNIGPSLTTIGCDNFSEDMDRVSIKANIKDANTTGDNPTDVANGVYVVSNPNKVPLPGIISQNIYIGSSETNTKTITLPAQAARASPKPVNEQDPTWNNKFETTLIENGTKLKVKRLDADSGWGQLLILKVDFYSHSP